jgi:hypothetical protein
LALENKAKIKHFLHLILKEVLSKESHYLNEDIGFRIFGEKVIIDMAMIPKKKRSMP